MRAILRRSSYSYSWTLINRGSGGLQRGGGGASHSANWGPEWQEAIGVAAQPTIEHGVWGGTSTSSTDSYSGSNQIAKAQALSELELTLGQKERAIQANDVTAQKHIEVLQQLRKLVEAGVSQEELRQILAQLRSLARTAPTQATPPPAGSYPASASTYPYPAKPTQPPQPTYTRPFQPKPVESEPVDPSALLPSASASAPAPAPASSAIAPNNLANLHSRTPPPPTSPARDASRAYRKAVLSEKIQLTTADIARKRSSALYLLYDRLPAQCKQCGVRFGDDSGGRKETNDRLDVRFGRSRRASRNMGRGRSWSWFVDVEDWTHEGVVDVRGRGRADGVRPTSFKAVATAEAAQRDAEPRAQFVVVPPGDEAKPTSCPICKEAIGSNFSEHAKGRPSVDYHTTRHSEAAKSAQSLASRLHNEASSRNRSRTPETSAMRTTPPKGTTSGLRPSLSPSPESKRTMLKCKIVGNDRYSV
ncbi:hypothetical protein HYDPIDRAFT_23077 [Hydnomerulius pinastri MD-312]|nr:hypothetical protein HYDPIDRAFT_23077 [Hydnomerulius pinastri MD-312]